jgi:RimJ/RimL family protein N-acetyltransferase
MNAIAERIEELPVDTPAELPWDRTRRLVLREFGPGDRADLLAMHRDPRVRAHLVDDYPLHEPLVVGLFLQRMATLYRRYEGLGIWHATMLEPRHEFAGWFNLMPMAERPGEVELGSRLLPGAWGTGVALDGCELLLDHAFGRLDLPRVWGICHPNNRNARAVLEMQGFEDLGLMPYDGQPACHYRITLEAWAVWRLQPRSARLRRVLARRHGVPAK